MGISDQIFLFGTLFPDMVRKFWLSYGRFLLTSKRNPRCVYVTSLCIAIAVNLIICALVPGLGAAVEGTVLGQGDGAAAAGVGPVYTHIATFV